MSSGAAASQNPNKRQKINGGVFTKYPFPQTSTSRRPYPQQLQQGHAPRRGFTHPTFSQPYQQNTGLRPQLSANSNQPEAWQQHSWPQSPQSRHHSHQWHSPGYQKSTNANSFHRNNSYPCANSSIPINAIQPQTHLKQHQPGSLSAAMPASPDDVSQRPWQGSLMEKKGPLLSQEDARNAGQQSESSEHETQGEQAEELWWEELQGLDYSEDASDSRYAGEIISHLLPTVS
jgi:hypothetical protein